MENIKKITIAASIFYPQGGGEYGYYHNLFGIFPTSAVTFGEKKIIPTDKKEFDSRWEIPFAVDEKKLRLGDFVAVVDKHHAYGGMSHGDEIRIVAHRLPIGAEIPASWESVGGKKSDSNGDYEEKFSWSFVRTSDGSRVSFEDAVKELGLIEMAHPFGKLWLDGKKPVAVNELHKWRSPGGACRERLHVSSKIIRGNRKFFASKGLAVLEVNDKDAYHQKGVYVSCSQDVILRNLELFNLREEGWYPVEVKEHFVLWGTGLHLYPKHLAWQNGLDPAHDTEDKCGTRIFDASQDRLERVREFFSESIGQDAVNPKQEYVCFANESDPRHGQWRNGYHYPAPWVPHFKGWALARFGEIECRWKQPKSGAARFYGLVK